METGDNDDDPRHGPALEAIERHGQFGGRLVWGDLTSELMGKRLAQGAPLLTGTNGTDLHPCARETEVGPDDLWCNAFGHVIVLPLTPVDRRGWETAVTALALVNFQGQTQ